MAPDPHSAEFPLARRVVGALVRNLAFVIGLPVLGVAVAGVATLLEPERYQDQAILEVGLRFLETPVEPAYEARERVADALVRADGFSQDVDIDVFIRRLEKTATPSRGLDVAVRASSATVAKAVLDQGLARVLAAHSAYHAEAVAGAQTVVDRLNALAARVEASKRLVATGTAAAGLDVEMARVDRLRWGSEEVLAILQAAPTEVRARPAAPERVPSRAPAWLLGGLVAGLMLGISIALLKGEPGPA